MHCKRRIGAIMHCKRRLGVHRNDPDYFFWPSPIHRLVRDWHELVGGGGLFTFKPWRMRTLYCVVLVHKPGQSKMTVRCQWMWARYMLRLWSQSHSNLCFSCAAPFTRSARILSHLSFSFRKGRLS